jgi:hypothetical protein
MQRSAWVLTAACILLPFLRPAAGDVFILHSGGRLEGDLANADEKPRTSYVINLSSGGQVTLDASLVDRVQSVKPELVEYEKARRQAPDTVQGQLQMAQWCKEHDLPAQRKTHLERVIQLDPDQVEARRSLGYQKYKDQWMMYEEVQADKGYVKVGDRWLTQPQAELQADQTKQRKAEIEWVRKISRWRALLDGRTAEEGARNLRAISDPMAIFGLNERLVKKPDVKSEARLMYVEALGRINHPAARRSLAICAIDDELDEVRLCCLDELEKQRDELQKDDSVRSYFERRMRDKHTSNAVINRAGVALGRIKDPKSIDTLIEYLVTVHDIVIPPAGGPGSMTTGFNKNGGGGGLAMNQKPVVVQQTMQNQGVLDALINITGENFGFDFQAWRFWYNRQKLKGGPVEAKAKAKG